MMTKISTSEKFVGESQLIWLIMIN